MFMLRLQNLRKEKKFSQQKIAIDLKVSQSSISKYEVGTSEPDIAMLINLARYFNVSVDYLLGNSEAKNPLLKSDLTEAESNHMTVYRILSDSQKERVEAYIEGMRSN